MKSIRKFSALLLAAAILVPAGTYAQAEPGDDMQHGLQTLWEALWHQSGTPTRLVRWDTDIRMRVSGVDIQRHRPEILKALQAVSQETGVKVIDVTDQPDQPANVTIEVVPDTALEENQPCVTQLDFRTETRIDSADMQMRSRDVDRCAHHEAMHLMGVRGHPEGRTVLSYFPVQTDALLPLDKAMLRAWYSQKMRPGMTPFEALPVLADELVAIQPDKQAAAQVRDKFFAETVQEMNAFANGKGDIPQIIRRSGKATDDGVRMGRSEMSYFLGVAYLEGATVRADRKEAISWFERAASAGNRRAQVQLGSFR